MPEEVEVVSKPLVAGEMILGEKDFPNNQMFEAHVDDVTLDNFGEGDKLGVAFVIDQEGEFKGRRFKKWFKPITGDRAGFTRLTETIMQEAQGEIDPVSIKGKPLQVMFQPDSFNGKKYQKAIYLAPAKGQTVPAEADPVMDAANEIFGAKLEAK